MKSLIPLTIATAFFLAPSAHADEVEDVIATALEAYQAGDVSDALEELNYASQLLGQMRSASLAALLPDAPEGWTRMEGDSSNAAAMMFGGGLQASANYSNSANGEQISISLMADSPMVSSMGAMFGNAATMGAMGKVTRIQRETFVIADREITGLIDKRVLLKAEGNNVEAMQALIEAMDLGAVADF